MKPSLQARLDSLSSRLEELNRLLSSEGGVLRASGTMEDMEDEGGPLRSRVTAIGRREVEDGTVNVWMVVPVRNAARKLPYCLSALARLDPAPAEIIRIDNG